VLLFAILAAFFVKPVMGQDSRARWYVYNDSGSDENHGEWTNLVPAQAAQMIKLSLVDRTRPFSGTTAVRVDVKFLEPWWCGIAVASFADYWGKKPSAAAYDLRGARKLVFYARGEKGGEGLQIKTAITGDQKYGDSAKLPAATKWLVLTKDWQRYELDLAGLDLKRVVTPFSFVTNRDHNADPAVTFYLDDIYFEMSAAK
jgi:hypothetical protein